MVPAGSAPAGNASIPILFQSDLNNLDVFLGIDSTGIDVIATTTTTPLTPPVNALCPGQQITYATEVASTGPTFYPLHINLRGALSIPSISLFRPMARRYTSSPATRVF